MKISIIIPTYNEEARIKKTLDGLIRNISSTNYIEEIIVVDAQSKDRTQDIVNTFPTLTLLNSKKGRPLQMNFGAEYAKGKALYFLHADSLPPKGFDKHIVEAINNNHHAGCFRMSFKSQHLWLKLVSWLTRFNYRACRGGDQSLFVTKALFRSCGGYNEDFLIYEDHDIIGKLYKKTNFHVVPKTLIASARRYKEKGVFKLQFLYLCVYVKKWLGYSPKKIYKFYKKWID